MRRVFAAVSHDGESSEVEAVYDTAQGIVTWFLRFAWPDKLVPDGGGDARETAQRWGADPGRRLNFRHLDPLDPDRPGRIEWHLEVLFVCENGWDR